LALSFKTDIIYTKAIIQEEIFMTTNFKRQWRGFWQLADPKIWVASTVPMVCGAAMAYGLEGVFNIYWFLWCLAGIYLIEIGKNAINEFVDYESGVDRFIAPEKRTPFSGGKKTIVDGLLTVRETKVIAVVTMAGAAVIGLYIAMVREPMVLWVGLLGFLLAAFYSMPPFKLAYRGFGEFVVGFTFGPLVMGGTYLVQTHSLRLEVVPASLVLGFLIANVLLINQYPDYEADVRGQKKNWVVRLGKQKAVGVYTALFVMAYVSLLPLIIFTGSPVWLLTFLSIPLARRAIAEAKKYYDDIPRLMEANVKTVQVYQLTGLMLAIAALI
jgi:1,4-dihydroxy-2-naphthoate octaprenyltransferase